MLALDTLRALHAGDNGLSPLQSAIAHSLETVRDPRLADAARIARSALDHAASWLADAERAGSPALEAGARRFALTLGRTMELVLLIKHAQWSQDHEHDGRATAAARRFASSGVDLIVDYDDVDFSSTDYTDSIKPSV